MPKQLAFKDDAREELKDGIDELAKAVTTTLGPKGRNVALGKKWGAPTVTHDGVTVARDIELWGAFSNMGVQLIKEAASKTNDIAGDGTTTATILAQSMVIEGLKNIAAGANAMLIKQGMQQATNALIEAIKEIAIPVDTSEQIADVASISAQNRGIGELIAEVMEKVGKDGVITVEDGKGLTFETEYVEGMHFNRGYISPHFITNVETQEVELDEPYILLHDQKISAVDELVPVLEKLMQAGKRDLLIIADDIERDALSMLVLNKMRGTFNIAAIKAPEFGERRKPQMQDIAVVTGGLVVEKETGRDLSTVKLEDLGRCEKVVITKDDTTIIGGRGSEEAIADRIKQIRGQIAHAVSNYDEEKLQQRLAKLAGGVAVIGVGAATEVELKEKKHRVEDALSATRAAIEEGIVPGGGVALINVMPALDNVTSDIPDVQTGINVVRNSLSQPMRGIMRNAGLDGAVVVNKIQRQQKEQKNNNIGFDVISGEYKDMVEAGIIDPAKVTRGALTNATSSAAMILTTEALVTDIKELEPPTPKPRPAVTYS
jgi:chaperonin GroEL